MLAENPHQVHSGRLAKDIHLPATAKLELMAFIAGELPHWRDHPDRPDKENETGLTEFLCDHLNGAANHSTGWSHVQFRTETGDEAKGGRKIDFALKPRGCALVIEGRRHSQFEALFPIECKRLPTPKGKDRDEREYVFTKESTTGGVQRFKFGHHGSTHDFAAMIGYVQERDFTHWLNEINGWIRSLANEADSAWSEADLLEKANDESTEDVCALHSCHSRPFGLALCRLRHLWIRMN
jgi:hypothetical protein